MRFVRVTLYVGMTGYRLNWSSLTHHALQDKDKRSDIYSRSFLIVLVFYICSDFLQNVSSSLIPYCWCAKFRYAHCCLEIRNFSLLLRRVHRYGLLSTYKRLVTYLPLSLKDLASLGRSRNELTSKIVLLKGLPITIFGMSIVTCLPTVNRKISTPSF